MSLNSNLEKRKELLSKSYGELLCLYLDMLIDKQQLFKDVYVDFSSLTGDINDYLWGTYKVLDAEGGYIFSPHISHLEDNTNVAVLIDKSDILRVTEEDCQNFYLHCNGLPSKEKIVNELITTYPSVVSKYSNLFGLSTRNRAGAFDESNWLNFEGGARRRTRTKRRKSRRRTHHRRSK